MRLRLVNIPFVDEGPQSRCRVVALEMDGKCPVLADLLDWKRNAKADFKKIVKVMRYVGQLGRVRNEKHVKKSDNPRHGEIYEMRAHKGSARVMFFYDERGQAIAVCTNTYFKTKPSRQEQDETFELCARMRTLYKNG
ncbi:MAG: type II toxin-antitoxin system RelE/ParE family toxin [Lentisphaerota bacterium]